MGSEVASYCLLPTAYRLLPTAYCLPSLPTAYCLCKLRSRIVALRPLSGFSGSQGIFTV